MGTIPNPCAHAALHRSLLEFWCRARGWVLKSVDGDRAVIDQGEGDVVWSAGDLFARVVRSSGEAAELAALAWLSRRTHAVRHNPNCPSPYEVRIAGTAGAVDSRLPGAVGYGASLAEAVAELRAAQEDAGGRAA